MKTKETQSYTGADASEIFNLNEGYKVWIDRSNLSLVVKTKEEWEKFFKQNGVI